MNALPAPQLFADPEARLAALDTLPRRHWLGGLTNALGTLDPRLTALVALRKDLFDAVLPAPTFAIWPVPAAAEAVTATFDALGLPGYCRHLQSLADTVVMSLLFHFDFVVDYRDRGATPDEAVQRALDAFAADWEERCGQFDELIEVFGQLPDDDKNTRWDRIKGLLRSDGWQAVLQARRLLARLPELHRLIERLGRSVEASESDTAVPVTVNTPQAVGVPKVAKRRIRVPDLPGETRGVHRADRIARMLPAESMLLGHPQLRLVWHARRAEHTLLCYEDDDHLELAATQPRPDLIPLPGPQSTPRRERGPILVCVDTSGSMQGGAEAVAKAAVLEAMCAAHLQRRACHVIAFGGPDELLDFELGFDAVGIERLTHFLGQAFRGGTDICGPLERVLEKMEVARWRKADLLVATDGEFGATPDLVARLNRMKQDVGLRVHGLLIGDRETVGLLEIADTILPVRDWRKFGGAKVESPVHSHRLTALYFPGALRNEENRAATVSPEVAAGVMLKGKPA